VNGLDETIRYHAAALDAARAQPRFAVVQSVDATRHLAKVSIQPEAVPTGWLPILALGGGQGWGMICPPAIGAQVVVVPLDGDHENLAVLGAAWSTASLPPAPASVPGGAAAAVQPGEMALVSAAGAYIRLNQDGGVTLLSAGKIQVQAAGDVDVTAQANANVTIAGALAVTAGNGANVAVTGNASLSATGTIALAAPLVDAGNGTMQPLCTAQVWNYIVSHTHADPQGGSTSPPQQAAPGAPTTTNLKAS
jgi:phage gp45-like